MYAKIALAAAIWLAAPVSAGTLNDAHVLGTYIQVNGFDIESALLARAQSDSPAVRELAEHVAKDHVAVRQAALDLTTQCKVAPALPEGRNAAAIEHGATVTTLLALHGAEFDKAYLRHEVAFHRAAIEAVRSALLPAARCPALAAHLRDVLPAFEHHLMQTEALAREIGIR